MSDITLGVGLDFTTLRKELAQLGDEVQRELSALNISPGQLSMISSLSSMQNSAQTAASTRSIARSSSDIASSVSSLVNTQQATTNAVRQTAEEQRKQQSVIHGRYGSYDRGTHQTASRMTHAINTLSSMAQSGMSDSSILRGIGGTLSMLGPYGQVAGAVLNLAAAGQEQEKNTGTQRLRLYQTGGNEARSLYHQLGNASMAGSNLIGWSKGSMQDLGLTRQDIASIIGTLSKDTGSLKAVWDIAKLEAGYKLGGGSMSLLRSVSAQGGDADRKALAQAMGLYFAQALERGRIGEAFSFMGKIVQSGTAGVAPNMSEVGKTAEFIGGMGTAYRGDTAASSQALASLRHMATGEGGGASRIFALRAAGLGTGSDYWSAVMESSKGLEQSGSNVARRVVSQYAEMSSVKTAWLSGDKSKASVLFSMLSGGAVKPYIAERLLDSYYSGHGSKDVTEGRERAINNSFDNVKLPKGDREAIDDENRKAWLLERDAYYGSNAQRVGSDLGGRSIEGGAPSIPLGGYSDISSFKKAYGDNYGETRDNAIVNGKYVPGKRIHDAVDINLPPGSAVHLVVGGRVRSVSQAMSDPAYGFCLELEGEDGRLYKYVHLASKPNVAVNAYLKAGTLIGHTLRNKFPGGSASHLHLSMTDRSGRSLNPYKTLPISAFNRMLGVVPKFNDDTSVGVSNMAQEVSKSVESPNVNSTAAQSSTSNVVSQSNVRVDVFVKDDRISVAKRATVGNAPVRLMGG